jgi:hypothetical protein
MLALRRRDPFNAACAVRQLVNNRQGSPHRFLAAYRFQLWALLSRPLIPNAFNIQGYNAKHDYANGGDLAGPSAFVFVFMERLTPNRVNGWRVQALDVRRDNPPEIKPTRLQ